MPTSQRSPGTFLVNKCGFIIIVARLVVVGVLHTVEKHWRFSERRNGPRERGLLITALRPVLHFGFFFFLVGRFRRQGTVFELTAVQNLGQFDDWVSLFLSKRWEERSGARTFTEEAVGTHVSREGGVVVFGHFVIA